MKSMSQWAIKDFLKSGRASDSVLMVTLTSADIISGDVCRDALNRFMTALKKHYKKKLRYFVVRELQKRGAYHYHIVFLDLLYIPHYLCSRFWRIGWVWLSVKRGHKAIAYILKYVTKDVGKQGRLHSSYVALSPIRLAWHKVKSWYSFNYHFAVFMSNCMLDKINVVKYYTRLLEHFKKSWAVWGLKNKLRTTMFIPFAFVGVA